MVTLVILFIPKLISPLRSFKRQTDNLGFFYSNEFPLLSLQEDSTKQTRSLFYALIVSMVRLLR